MTVRFADIHPPRPDEQRLAARHAAIGARLDAGDLAGALRDWDGLRREVSSWVALAHLRFSQDTTDAEAIALRDAADALEPVIAAHDTALKRRLLERAEAAAEIVGAHAVRMWRADIGCFDPAIADLLVEESRLSAQYTALLAAARLRVGGEEVNLSGLAWHAESPDRARRHEAERARWDYFAAHGAELDAIYDRLVKLRHEMARILGDETFTALAYRRMHRLDYGPDDVAAWRDEVAARVVPLVSRLLERRRAENGWDRLMAWDEALVDPEGNPGPAGGHDFLVAQAQTMFDRLDPRMGAFYRGMVQGGFLDLDNRPSKAGGGFCTSFPTHGTPFIFANFNGTPHDITVFTHEMGHAFQNHESRNLGWIDLLWPTMEAAEINSMGLEFLTHDQIGLLVGEANAARFRRMHLITSLAFLPYGVCVDHFQHEVYANPGATPEQRHAIWQRLERRYMPWRDWGDLAWPAKGGAWQAKQHIYRSPFYYIDYTLALCCAMQLWVRARRDHEGALAAYVALAERGGSAPFGELVRGAGLASPFAEGALADAVAEAESVLLPGG